jgi:hypothetical protein
MMRDSLRGKNGAFTTTISNLFFSLSEEGVQAENKQQRQQRRHFERVCEHSVVGLGSQFQQ